MPPKPKPPPKEEVVVDELQLVQNEFNEIQRYMQHERIVSSQRWSVQKKLLIETLRSIDYIRRNMVKLRNRRKRNTAWEDYFKCDGLPHAFRPHEVLAWLAQWTYEFEKSNAAKYDWSLSRNELTLLTQDRSIPEQTMEKLRDNHVEGAAKLVQIMDTVEYVLNGLRKANHVEKGYYTNKEKAMLRTYRNQIQTNMKKCIDVYVDNILNNMERDMEPLEIKIKEEGEGFSSRSQAQRNKEQQYKTITDITILQHSFRNDKFSLHIWALRNIPQPPRTSRHRYKIPLAPFGGEAIFPFAIGMQDLAIRSYWTSYDHYSVHCPNYSLQEQPLPVVDILTALNEEWITREMIDEQKLAYLTWQRDNFTEAIQIRQAAEENMRQPKGKKEKKKKSKVKKTEKPSFGDLKNYDSKAQYISTEDAKYLSELQKMYPDAKSRVTGDINLRSHQIIGGVFHVEFVLKPNIRTDYYIHQMMQMRACPSDISNFQTLRVHDSRGSSMSLRPSLSPERPSALSKQSILLQAPRASDVSPQTKQSSSIAVTRKSAIQPPRSSKVNSDADTSAARKSKPELHRKSLKPTLRETLRRSEALLGSSSKVRVDEDQSGLSLPRENLAMVEFRIKLSPNVIWWTAPTVCYWEPWEYSKEFSHLSEDDQHFLRTWDGETEKTQKRLFAPKPKTRTGEKVIPDFDMQNIPKSVDIREVFKDLIVPKLPYHYQTFIDKVLDQRIEDEKKRRERIEMGLVESSIDATAVSKSRPKAELTPPTPLFIPSEGLHSQVVKVVASNKSEANSASMILYDESTDQLDRNMTALPIDSSDANDLKEDEFRPPNILFSEFYRQIIEEPADQAIEESNHDHQKESNIRSVSEDLGSVLGSQFSLPRASKRKSKRSKSRLRSERFKQTIGDMSSMDKPTIDETSTDAQEKLDTKHGSVHAHSKGRWCTRHIVDQKYHESTNTITFRSPCFGAYALAVNRYIHMPYNNWSMCPDTEKHNHVTFNLRTPLVGLEIDISSDGFMLVLPPKSKIPIDPKQGPLPLYDFKQMLTNAGLNVFPERDGGCYVAETMEKHLSMEYHTYYSMACFNKSYRFKRSPWNKFSHRRKIIIALQDLSFEARSIAQSFFDVLITPNECYRVKVTEECSMDLNDMTLNYDLDPPEQEYYPDLYFFLKSNFVGATLKDADDHELELIYNIAQLLWSIRPISFS